MYKNSRNISSTCFLWINHWKVKFSQLLWTRFCMPSSSPHTQNIYILNPHSQCLKMWLHLEAGSLRRCVHAKSLQSCLTLWDPMDCTLPGFSVHEILQARILEWIAMSSSRGSSQPRNPTCVSNISCFGRHILYHWATWEAWFMVILISYQASLITQLVKNPPATQEILVQFLCPEDPLDKG